MGNILSAPPDGNTTNRNHTSESDTMDDMNLREEENIDSEQFHDTIDNDEEARAFRRQEKLNEFKKQLDVKREQRKEILARHRSEKKKLEDAFYAERKSKMEVLETNKGLRKLLEENNIMIPNDLCSNEDIDIAQSIMQMGEEVEKLKSSNNELRINLVSSNKALQEAYSDIADLSAQNTESMKQINALKEVIAVSKTMINLREDQLNELKQKLNEIEQSLADREASMLSTDLRQEYERQLQNIRTLRGLYEERARLADVTKQALVRELNEHKILLQAEVKKNADLNNKVDELETKVNRLEDIIDDKNHLIASVQEETRGLKSEMSVVNKLFSQVLLGYQSKNYLDTLVHRLEENHGLLTHMAEKENGSEVSTALPKLLLEIIEENDKNDSPDPPDDAVLKNEENAADTDKQMPSKAEEIVQNLPKVWRVLMELLSHQSESEVTSSEKVTTCYKSVNTKAGPVLVPSVSQTYIRLKDLILEKLALIKEVNRMKQLNTHLETRLGEQEKRLCLVTNELTKTWHVVGRLRRHHHQLHTHEKILKYELQQKRKLLNELKEELEYCREKCDQAREKNSQSEKDWKKLRAEFSSRKLKIDATSLHNSAESGYSDERASDESSESNDESEYVTEPKIKCKKKIKNVIDAVIDSSADLNLVAEREDPASDMLDVAELPLDNQDDKSDILDVSISCNSENCLKSDNNVETEDECADIGNDSCIEDISLTDRALNNGIEKISINNSEKCEVKQQNTTFEGNEMETNQATTSVLIDSSEILRNIQKQNERLALKDKRLESLEKDTTDLLKKTQTITTLRNKIDNTLDVILNRPTTSTEIAHKNGETKNGNETSNDNIQINLLEDNKLCIEEFSIHNNENKDSIIDNLNNDHSNSPTKDVSVLIDPAIILKNIQQQNERLALKDKKLESLEKDSTALLEKTQKTIIRSNEIDSALDVIMNRPTTSKECASDISNMNENSEQTQNTVDLTNENNDSPHEQENKQSPNDFDINYSSQIQLQMNEDLNPEIRVEENAVCNADDNMKTTTEPSTSGEVDHEARFAARELRLQRLEEQTKSLVSKVNKTKTKGVKIHYKLEELHNIYGSENSRSGTPSEDTEDISQSNSEGKEEASQNTDED